MKNPCIQCPRPYGFKPLLALVGWCLLAVTQAPAQVTGQWDFKQGNLAATVGRDLAYFDGAGGETELASRFGTTAWLGIPGLGCCAVAGKRLVMQTGRTRCCQGDCHAHDMQANLWYDLTVSNDS